jgi:DNA-binding response OmpR family regulator
MNKTVLIVEDEVALRSVITSFLEKSNFSVLTAENGKEGVTLALAKHPDLILLDLLMPVMSGMEALKKIRSDTWGAKVPVIILTNLSATKEDLIQDMVKSKPLYYLIKSDWKLEDVIKKIQEILK